ncbi:MAG: VWA domain-containing protein [Pyrinomonadaceae bacterium]
MMKIKLSTIFLPIFCLVLTIAFAFYSYPAAGAQTVPGTKKTPTPTPPVIKSSVPPTATPTATPNPDDEVIRIDTQEVTLNVRVVDRNNRPVNNLPESAFKVYEDNNLQTLTSFSKAEVPTNYALVIDNSGSLRGQLDKVIEASKIIVGTNRPDDDTSVIRFVNSDKIEVTQDFTSNKNDLDDALDNLFIEGGQTAIIDAVYLAAEKTDQYEKSSDPNDKKRRALILVSDGEDRDSFYKEQQLFQLLRETDVQIYTVGFINELDKSGGFVSKSPQAKAKSLLERLASETGGKSYFPNSVNELNDIAKDISSELRTQYLLSYSPTENEGNAAFRNIKVTIDDGPNNQKRIAITRSGRTVAPPKSGNKPAQQKPTKP